MLRDVVKFRTEIDVGPGYLDTEFFIKAELFYQAPPTNNFSRCMNSPKDMQYELQKSGEQFKMVQARLYRLNKGLLGQSSFIPVLFDREYTCLTMATVHASLIDYRFRMLPQPRREVMMKNSKSGEFVDLMGTCSEEDQTFIQNGIIVEAKTDLTEAERNQIHQQYVMKQM